MLPEVYKNMLNISLGTVFGLQTTSDKISTFLKYTNLEKFVTGISVHSTQQAE